MQGGFRLQSVMPQPHNNNVGYANLASLTAKIVPLAAILLMEDDSKLHELPPESNAMIAI
jgi:hypothetical protein